MKERPILFSGPMVRAILDGRKTQTRRIVNCNASNRVGLHGKQWHIQDPNAMLGCPYGQPGDRLWVRETFGVHCDLNNVPLSHTGIGWIGYRADESGCPYSLINNWRPSIFMPRQLSRITLEVIAVRVERLQDISPDDCRAEGEPADNNDVGVRYGYGQLWDSINGKTYPWESNPWVWAITFKRIQP